MLKAVISNPKTPPLPTVSFNSQPTTSKPLFLESTSNNENSIIRTKVETSPPFFQNPCIQKIQTLEQDLQNVLSSGMNSSQKSLLYQSVLNDLLALNRKQNLKTTNQTLNPPSVSSTSSLRSFPSTHSSPSSRRSRSRSQSTTTSYRSRPRSRSSNWRRVLFNAVTPNNAQRIPDYPAKRKLDLESPHSNHASPILLEYPNITSMRLRSRHVKDKAQ